jgi:hypothetical protein
MSEGPAWFAPKRYGYGSGMPISWQGWAITIGYVAIVLLLAFGLSRRPAQLVAALVPITALFLVVCARTTRGGWRWRWGDSDTNGD